jgi:hypothetical protein
MSNNFETPEALRSLGTPLRVHPPRAAAGRAGYLTIAAVFLGVAGLAAIGIVNPPQHNPPPAVVLMSAMGVCCVLSVVFFGVGMYVQSYTLILFPEALARTGGDVPEIFRWSDVKELYTFINPVAGRHRIVTQDGRKLDIDARVQGGKELGNTVQQILFDRMRPDAVRTFEGGGMLTFGPLRLDQTSLYYKEKRLAWDGIAKMGLLYNAYSRSVQFEVKAAGSAFLPWCVVKSQDIPNLDIFKMLAERKKSFTR